MRPGSMHELVFGVDTFNEADVEQRDVEYTYDDGDGFNFIDQSNYESIHLYLNNKILSVTIIITFI